MHLNCLQENLSHGLGIVQRAVATRTTLPITQHVLVSTDEGRLKLSATNLEIAISTWVGAEVVEEGAITVPARLLTDFVNSLSRQTIEVKTISPGRGIEPGRACRHSWWWLRLAQVHRALPQVSLDDLEMSRLWLSASHSHPPLSQFRDCV